MTKQTWKVSIRLDGQDNYHMLVKAVKVEKINDYSLSADGIAIQFNDPIESVELITENETCCVYVEIPDDTKWVKQYIKCIGIHYAFVDKVNATPLTAEDAMIICKQLNDGLNVYRIEDL